MRVILRLTSCLCLMFLLIIHVGCGSLSEESDSNSLTDQGSFLSFTYDFYPLSLLEGVFALTDANTGNALSGAGMAPQFSVNQYNISFYSIDDSGDVVQLSAKLLIPSYNQNIDLIVFMHGSTTLFSDAPTETYADFSSFDNVNSSTIDTNLSSNTESLFLTLLASEGHAILMPDYIGFGDSEGLHPYIQSESVAVNSIDALRAAIEFANSDAVSFSLSGDYVITGYSQGGYSTMAMHKELINNSSNYSDIESDSLKAVIPGSPPCNLSIVMANEMINNDTYVFPAFATYAMMSYNDTYSLYDDYYEPFGDDYQDLPDYFDGYNSLTVINELVASALPPITMFTDTFQSEITAAFNDYAADGTLDSATDSGFYEAIIENDVHNYDPGSTTPYYLLHLYQDDTVPITNSEIALQYMATVGSAVIGSNLFLLDPAAYALTGSTDYTSGTISNHSTGFIYDFVVLRGLADSVLTN